MTEPLNDSLQNIKLQLQYLNATLSMMANSLASIADNTKPAAPPERIQKLRILEPGDWVDVEVEGRREVGQVVFTEEKWAKVRFRDLPTTAWYGIADIQRTPTQMTLPGMED